MPSIDETLTERGNRYGAFVDHASITQGIKTAMAQGENWGNMDDDQQECLEMVAHKIGRILNGDPNYVDSWTDIIGYARLVEKRLIEDYAKLAAIKHDADLNAAFQVSAAKYLREQAAQAEADLTDKELANKLRSLKPGIHYIHVAEESGEH